MRNHIKNAKSSAKIVRSLLLSGLAALGVVVATFSAQPVSAACTAPATNYGSATVKLNVDTTTDYRLWVHMYAPSTTDDSVLLEVDGGNCYVVGDGGVGAKAWMWVNHQNGSTANRITTTLSKGTHTLKLIGREPSVKVDRVMAVSDQNCTPVNAGDNCISTADTTKPTVNITSPADGATITGNTTIKANATDNTGVGKVEFYVQNQLVSTVKSTPYEYAWNVAGQASGTVTLTVKAYDDAGNVSTDSEAVILSSNSTKPPAVPTGVNATASAYNKVNLQWNGVAGAASYRVVRNNAVIATTGSTSYTDTTVAAGTAYNYSVVAVDANNNASDTSPGVKVTTPQPPTTDATAPTKPTSLSATALSETQINIAWKASTDNVGVKEYDIYRNSDEDKTFHKVATTTKTSYGDGGVYDNTTFTYYVVARDASGNQSPPSDQAAARTPRLADRRTSTLRGTVEASNGRPLSGVHVTLWVDGERHTTTTNWRGRYIITDIPAGRYDVQFRKYGYGRSTETVRLSPHSTKWQDVTLDR